MKHRLDILLILVLLGLSLLFFSDVLQAGDSWILQGLDLDRLFYPLGQFTALAYQEGRIPMWNPYIQLGFPQYGEPQLSTFYPPMLLLGFLPVGTAYSLLYALHFGLAGAGGYVFVRQLGGRWAGAFITGLVLEFNLFMAAHLLAGHLPHVMTITYLPWVMAAALWAVKKGSWQATILAGLPLGLAMLAGYAPFFPFLVVIVSLLMLWLAFLAWRRDGAAAGVRILVQLVGLGIVSGMIAAVQLLPTLEFASQSGRVATANYGFASSLSMPWWNLLTLLVPDVYGAPMSAVEYWAPAVHVSYWEFAIYAGILPLVLFGLAWVIVDKDFRFWHVVSVVAILAALGPAGAIHRLLFQLIPGFGLFRVPGRMSFLFTFIVAFLAGLAFDKWLDLPDERYKSLRKILIQLCGAIVILLLVLISFTLLGQAVLVDEIQISRLGGVMDQLFRLTFFLTAVVILLAWGHGKPRWQVTILAAVILLVDLWGITNKLVALEPTEQSLGWLMANAALPEDRDSYRVLTTGLEENSGYFFGFHAIEGYILRTEGSLRLANMAFRDARVARLLGAKYLLFTQENTPSEGVPGWNVLTEPAGVTIHERTDIQPKAFTVHEVLAAADDAESLRLMANPDIDFTRTAVVHVVPNTECAIEPGDPANDKVEVVHYEPNKVILRATAASNAWLVLNDLYYPGWEVTVSGEPVPIQPTYFRLRGICLPAGTHEVVFQFRPTLLIVGAAISVLGVLLVLFAFLSLVIGKRRQPH